MQSTEPEDLLLEYVRNNEITKIRGLVQHNPELLEHQYKTCFNSKTIIQIVCSTFSAEVKPETVETLIDLGANLFSIYVEKQAIHYAAISRNKWLLETICSRIKGEGINNNSTDCRDTALLCIIKYCDCESKNAIECIKVLLDHNADVNRADIEDVSPILHAAMTGYRKVVALLLQYPNTDIDIDSHTLDNLTARDLIIEKNLYKKEKLPPRKKISSSLRCKMSKKRSGEESLHLEDNGCRGEQSFSFEMDQTNFIVTPEELLLEYVRNNETAKIIELVEDNRGLLEHEYEEPFYGKTIIHIVCSTLSSEVTKETVLTLINLGVDLSKPAEQYIGRRTIHFAATSLNKWLLNTICGHLTQEEIDDDSTHYGDTALNSIIKYCDCESKNALECIAILIDHNADVNKADCDDMSPILHAAWKGYRKVVALLLECPSIDLNSHTYGNRTAADYILELNLCDVKKLPPGTTSPSKKRLLLSEMFETLREGPGDEFLKLDITREVVNRSDGDETMLHICARLNLPGCARRLLEHGADAELVTWKYNISPIQIAAEKGNHEVYEEICAHLDEIPQFLFQCKLAPPTTKANLKKCLKLLLEKNRSLANKKLFGTTPLSQAIQWSDKEVILLLLNNGASLGDTDHGGKLPIDDIEIETLRKHFDDCITCSSDKIGDDDLLVTFNYKTLIPTGFDTKSVNTTIEEGYPGPDIELLGRNNRELDSEMSVISHIAQNKRLRPLLTHPLITSFTHLKWNRIRYFFYANLVLYLVAWLSITLYTLKMSTDRDLGEESVGSKMLLVVIWATFLIFIVKELFQLVVSPILYIKQIENLFEITFITSMGLILIQPEASDGSKKQIFAIAILVSGFQLVLLIGQLPKMSTNIIMLRTVSYSFFKLFLGNAILILAFSLSFYTLFSDITKSDKKLVDNSTESSEENFGFNGIGVSLLKTFVMMTGEFDASDIDFNTAPVMSRIIFLFFIFMVVIVLFNLMNGLAVSDTQEIRNNAKLFACKSRVDHICYIKDMLLGNLAVVPSKFFEFFKLPGFKFKIVLPKKISELARLFPNYLDCFEMVLYLNQKGKIRLPWRNKQVWLRGKFLKNFGFYEDVRIDDETLKNVRVLLKDRNRLEGADDSIQKKLGNVDESVQEKLKTLGDLLQKKFDTVYSSIQTKLETIDSSVQKKLETVDESVQNMLRAVDVSLQEKLETVDDSLQKKFDNIDGSTENKLEDVDVSIQKKFENIDGSIEKLKTVVGSVQKRLEDIEGQQKLMLENIRENMKKILERLN